jgi:hypothetical protein
MWVLGLLAACCFIVAALVLLARRAELLMLRWYECEVDELDIAERANETILTYPLA